MSDYKARLITFRQVLKRQKLDAFIVPVGDAWQSEHPAPCDQRFQYICGLDASAGYVVVTQDHAAVLIDGRYTVQAKRNLDSSLFNIAYYTDTMPIEYLAQHLNSNAVIGYDSWVHTKSQAKAMHELAQTHNLILHPTSNNPIDDTWHDRPTQETHKLSHHDIVYSGMSCEQKLHAVTDILKTSKADSLIITAPDSLAWVLNMRCFDTPQTPGLKGFSILHNNHLSVYTDMDYSAFIDSEAKPFQVTFHGINELSVATNHLAGTKQKIQISPDAPEWFNIHLDKAESTIIEAPCPVETLKAVKNKTEIKGIKTSQKRDATAMIAAIKRIKATSKLSEKDVANIVFEERAKSKKFCGVSFDTIAGWNANGAAIHGTPSDTIIKGNGLLLLDSGAQYNDGTTDITRTLLIGDATDEMKRAYTLVLKSHIAVATAIFPMGTTGAQIDALARAPLWTEGLDYPHGTGHGVGFALNVHEGPCGISPRSNASLAEGMLLSNEPGYYIEGKFGIRLENLVLVKKHKTKKFLCFETLTHVPFENDLIVKTMLSKTEKNWLNDYQSK
jgi:Xaa-Pro aminopeptidase